MPDYTLHLGDCLDIMATMPDASVDAGYFKIAEKRIKEATWQPALLREAAD